MSPVAVTAVDASASLRAFALVARRTGQTLNLAPRDAEALADLIESQEAKIKEIAS